MNLEEVNISRDQVEGEASVELFVLITKGRQKLEANPHYHAS